MADKLLIGQNPSTSPKEGTGPAAVAFADYDGGRVMFVALERTNAVMVYEASDSGSPTFLQLLPTGIGPEGILPLPGRNMVAIAIEANPGKGLPSTIDLFAVSVGD